jgi:hypothetical protein
LGARPGQQAVLGRLAVRTPMQWTSQRNGGFSNVAPSRLRRPLTEGTFGPEHVNVAAQPGDPDSLLGFIALLIKRCRESPELGWADFAVLDHPHRQVGKTDASSPSTTEPRALHGAAGPPGVRQESRRGRGRGRIAQELPFGAGVTRRTAGYARV